MRRIPTILALSLAVLLLADAQVAGPQWVFFKDKGVSAPADARSLNITDRALQRRAKVLPPNRLLDELDLPVAPEYLQALSAAGVSVRTVSRWLNAAAVEMPSPSAESAVRALPFVKSLRPVLATRKRPLIASKPPIPSFHKSGARTTMAYGTSQTQNANIHAIELHDAGVIGSGVLVGMLDDGFNYHREHPALKSIRVVAEYDFIQRDSNTSVQEGEYVSQGFHGSATLGTLAGYLPGSLIGPAYGASLALGKTEIDSIEVIQEEDNYVEGLEWLEALGADIVSTSLGYIDWYTQSQMDGATAITTKAARILARKGVLLVTAMGNEQNRFPLNTLNTMIAPADADSIISVGATFSDGILTGFSSTGPTADGRMKPEVVAQGAGVYAPPGTSPADFAFHSGTSFSTPLTAAAAALILSAHPDATPMQIRSALMTTADKSSDGTTKTSVWPNPHYGFGRVNATAAALSLGPVVSNLPLAHYYLLNGTPTMFVSVRALTNGTLDTDQFALFYRRRSETTYTRVPFSATATPGLYSASFPVAGSADTSFVGYITYGNQSGPVLRRPLGTATFDLRPTSDSVTALYPPGATPAVPTGIMLAPNYPNPFNAGTTFLFRTSRRDNVRLDVYDLLGRHVRTLFDGVASLGENVVSWSDVRDESGLPLASGVYVYRLSTPQGVLAGTMMLLK